MVTRNHRSKTCTSYQMITRCKVKLNHTVFDLDAGSLKAACAVLATSPQAENNCQHQALLTSISLRKHRCTFFKNCRRCKVAL